MKRSLKLRVTLWYSLILLLLSSLILYAMTDLNQTMLVNDVEKTLISSVSDLGRFIKDEYIAENDIPETMFYNSGIQMALYDKEENLVQGNLPFGIDKEIEFEDSYLKSVTFNRSNYYVYDRDILLDNNKEYWLRGMVSITDKTQVLQTITVFNFLFILLFVLVAGIGGFVILCKAFDPVKKISNTAKEITESTDLSNRIQIESGEDELHSLASIFNGMLDKVEQAFNKEKQFTSDASHELRTPISVILSECEYGSECLDNVGELKEVISSINNQANKMSKLVTELLTISRMDSNRLKINLEETDLSELLEFVCEEQEEIQTKNIVLKKEIDSEIFANVDRLLLTRLFVNLISNAYQYSEENTTITVYLRKENDKIVFSVKDEGIGISEEDLPKIWDRFYQADSSRTEERNGSSGLGLSMVKWIAETHNGKLEVESKLGKGSIFSFIM